MTQQLSTNTFGCAKWIVSSDATQGTHTTIAAALTSASSGDTIFIRPGTYTENLTLKAGVNLVAYDADPLTPNVTISGTCSFTAAGTVSISGIRLASNGAEFLSVTGSAASIVNLTNCYLTTAFDPGITFSTSSSSAAINMFYCQGKISASAKKYFAHSSAGTLNIEYCELTNTGASTTASTCSAGTTVIIYSNIYYPVTSSGTASLIIGHCLFNCVAINTTCVTFGGSGTQASRFVNYGSGSASSISVGGTLNTEYCDFTSTNTNPVVGAGTIQFSTLSFSDSGRGFTTTTKASQDLIVGRLTSPTQPSFMATLTNATSNVTGDNTVYTVIFNSEAFDQAANYDNTTGVFTAPVTGKYLFAASVTCTAIGAGHTQAQIFLVTTANSFLGTANSAAAVRNSGNIASYQVSAIANMTAGDTASITITVFNSTKTISISNSGANTYFSGQLIA